MPIILLAAGFLSIIIGILIFRDIQKDNKRGYEDKYGGNIKMYFASFGFCLIGIVVIFRTLLDLF